MELDFGLNWIMPLRTRNNLTISGVGGIIGLLVGLGVNSLLSNLAGIKTQSTLPILAIAFSFSLVVGVFFGIYPASKASKLKPVDALRFE